MQGLSGGCRAGLIIPKRCNQLAVDAIQPVGCDAAAVWLVEDGVYQVRPLPSSNLVPSGGIDGDMREAGGSVAESLVERSSTCKRTVPRSIG